MKPIISLLLSLMLTVSVSAQDNLDLETVFTRESFNNIPYREAEFNASKKAPVLVVYLHGRSASGTDNSKQLKKNAAWALVSYFQENNIHAVMIAPQCSKDRRWSERGKGSGTMSDLLQQLIKQTKKKYGAKRVYIFGESMGGSGTWRMLSDYPKLFSGGMIAASVPRDIDLKPVANTPLVLVLGDRDDVSSPERVDAVVAALKSYGAVLDYEVLPEKTHMETCQESFTSDRIMKVLSNR